MLALLSATAQAASDRQDVGRWFDRKGRPLPAAQAAAAAANLPPLLEGAPFAYPRRQNLMEVPGCVTTQFYIRPDGLTDRFLILDSKPKGMFDQSVLESLRFWKFEPRSKGRWAVLPIHFGFEVRVGTHLEKMRKDCVVPRITGQVLINGGKPLDGDKPLYPPALVESRTQGCVTVSFAVRPDGLADDYAVLDADPQQVFVPTTIQALNGWRFEPPSQAAQRSYARYQFLIPSAENGAAPRECLWPQGVPFPPTQETAP
ncbi:MAG TPA: energy transducer TonB [Solimonas sp.]|nr:energy transducer TonB [Solimonas sp.]